MEFIGVTTGQSSIMAIFPRWAGILGIPEARLVGRDLPLGASPAAYREALEQIRTSSVTVGALVTTHKVALLAAGRDLFTELDAYAELTEEVSAIVQRNGKLSGLAKDPLSAGSTLAELLGPGYFQRTSAEALIWGAGGAGVAIVVALLGRADQVNWPSRILVVDRQAERLDALARVLGRMNPAAAARVGLVLHDHPVQNDRVLGGLAPGGLVVNATGMGKDRPGSPITDAAIFPERGVAWELNYRGALGFLHQARRQEQLRGLVVADGWRYFLYGWSEVLAAVFGFELTPARFDALASAAEFARPGAR
jgi:shikimate 5-dehydrogenase